MDHEALTLHQALLQLLETQQDKEALPDAVGQLAEQYGLETYAEFIFIMASIKLQPFEALALWESSWQHKKTLSARLDRPVDIVVALLDYVMTRETYLTHPKVIDVMEFERVAQSAIRDGLTGIYNPGYIREQIEWEILKDRRYKRGGTIIIFDLNKFKQCNDDYGHLAGDAVLREFATLLKRHTRQSDAVGRYGGDEFLILMPATDVAGAFIVADRIRKAFEETTVRVPTGPPEGIRVTATGGIARYRGESGLNSKDLIEAADRALYQGKRDGANRVYVESLARDSVLEISEDLVTSVSPVEDAWPNPPRTIGRRSFQIHTALDVKPDQIIACRMTLPVSQKTVTCRGKVVEAADGRVVFHPVEVQPLDWKTINQIVIQNEYEDTLV